MQAFIELLNSGNSDHYVGMVFFCSQTLASNSNYFSQDENEVCCLL